MRKHKIVTFLSVLLVVMLFIPVVHADVTIDSYSEANQNTYRNLKANHPSPNSDDSAAGQSFECTGNYKITSAKFYLKKLGSPTGNAHAVLYAHSGTYGTSSVPTGAALGTSDDFDVSTLTTDWQLITFTFTGAQQYEMSASYYCIAFENPSSGIDSSNYPRDGEDSTTPTHAGNLFFYDSAGWQAVSARDCCFYVYGVAVGQEENFFGVINQQFALESTVTYALTRHGTMSQQISILTHRTWQFTVTSTINLVHTIESTIEIAVMRYVFGTINQVFTIVSERTFSFSIEGLINPTFTIESLAQFVPSILYFFGEINQVFSVLGWTDLTPPPVYATTGFVLACFALLAFIGLPILALIIWKVKR